MEFRDRIVELRRVKASDLRANAKNWRLHPEGQRSALSKMLADVGFVDALMAREIDGQLELIDGHLRTDIAEDSTVPVLITDLTDEEADKVLATFDPLAMLAIPDVQALSDLVEGINFDEHAEMRRLIADMTDDFEKDEEAGKSRGVEIPGMALQPHEHYDFLVVLASTTHEWNVLCDRLGLKPEMRRGRMGTCRAMRADKLLAALPARDQSK